MQEDAPGSDHEPVKQLLHVEAWLEPGTKENVPALQERQVICEVDPVVEDQVPALQLTQPDPSFQVPAAQVDEQVLDPSIENDPALQLEH